MKGRRRTFLGLRLVVDFVRVVLDRGGGWLRFGVRDLDGFCGVGDRRLFLFCLGFRFGHFIGRGNLGQRSGVPVRVYGRGSVGGGPEARREQPPYQFVVPVQVEGAALAAASGIFLPPRVHCPPEEVAVSQAAQHLAHVVAGVEAAPALGDFPRFRLPGPAPARRRFRPPGN